MKQILLIFALVFTISINAQIRSFFNDGTAMHEEPDEWTQSSYIEMPFNLYAIQPEWYNMSHDEQIRTLQKVFKQLDCKIVSASKNGFTAIPNCEDFRDDYGAYSDEPLFQISCSKGIIDLNGHAYSFYDIVTGVHNTLVSLDYLYEKFWI